MSGGYRDPYLIHNSALACFLLVGFISEYESQNSTHPLELSKLLLVLPLVWNESNRNALARRNAASSIESVLRETPVVKVDLQPRVKAHAAATLQGLNLAVASGLIELMRTDDARQSYSLAMTRWPRGIKASLPSELMKTTRQLAVWYSTVSTENLFKLLFGIPYEIHD